MRPVVMTQTLDLLSSSHLERILCGYVNATSKIQIIRIANVSNWYFERVIFPGERLFFEAVSEAQLEVYTDEMAGTTLIEKISCEHLCVNQMDALLSNTH